MIRTIKILTIMALISAANACAQSHSDGYTIASPAEFAQAIKSDSTAYILDVRTPEEFASGHITGAHNIDWLNQQQFMASAEKLPKDTTIYLYCRSGRRSAEASQYLSDKGYKVVDLDGGYLSWENFLKK